MRLRAIKKQTQTNPISNTVKIFLNLPEILNQIDRVASQLAKPTAFYLGKLQDALALDDPGSLNLPGFILSCMSTLSDVVHFEACLKFGGHTDIISTSLCNTMEYRNIIEFQNYGLPRRSSPQSEIVEKPGFAIKTATPRHASSAYSGERRMEAGGFEPPSRDVSRQASTCLVALLFFRLAKRQNDRLLTQLFRKGLALSARTTDSASLLCDALTRPTGKVRQDGPPN